ncbi:MAG: hypothetical protein ACTSR8_01550 [Promethearchaeota archaeon]
MEQNKIIYLYAYLASNLILIVINVYLPIYFYNYLNVSRIELAYVLIFAYSIFFVKPVLSLLFDKKPLNLKTLGIISGFGLLLSFIFFFISIRLLLVFAFFLSINFFFLSLLDICIDKMILVESNDSETQNKNAAITSFGSMLGAIIPNIIALFIFKDAESQIEWDSFFLSCLIVASPLVILLLVLPNIDYSYENQDLLTEDSEISKKIILLFSLFMFFAYADLLYQFPFEPWIINRYGKEMEDLFSMNRIAVFSIIVIFGVLLQVVGIVSAKEIRKYTINKVSRLTLLTFFVFATTICMLFATIISLIIFQSFLIYSSLMLTMNFFSGVTLVFLNAEIYEISKKKVAILQFIACFRIGAQLLFVPLGTYLSVFMMTEWIIITSMIILLFSLIPLVIISHDKSIS